MPVVDFTKEPLEVEASVVVWKQSLFNDVPVLAHPLDHQFGVSHGTHNRNLFDSAISDAPQQTREFRLVVRTMSKMGMFGEVECLAHHTEITNTGGSWISQRTSIEIQIYFFGSWRFNKHRRFEPSKHLRSSLHKLSDFGYT